MEIIFFEDKESDLEELKKSYAEELKRLGANYGSGKLEKKDYETLKLQLDKNYKSS